MNIGKMVSKPNFLLEYAIDSLLKTFNPERKPVMPQSHFFKLMNLLDTRLKKQGVDIGLPGYWYKYGFFIEMRFLDAVLPRKFSEFYMISGTHVAPPRHPRRNYDIKEEVKRKIDSAIHRLERYRFKSDYGAKAKRESYEINAPYKFNTSFQDYIEIASRTENGFLTKKENLEPVLDKLLSEFPEKEFPELYSTYLEWDDTVRLILDCVTEEKQGELIKKLMELFWDTYSKGVRIKHNQNIPIPGLVDQWKAEYINSIPDSDREIESTRKKVLLEHYRQSGKDEKLVKQLMKKAYDISREGRVDCPFSR